jgi:aspartyl-tRNA(Asn)/glutamyl-tRNA(Gln) amidotransferase subunit A
MQALLNCFVGASKSVHPPTSSGALAGWRVAVKANLCWPGAPRDAASASLAGYRPAHASTAVSRAFAAGATILGPSTNMDEFGMGSATAFSVHGAARSPFSLNAAAWAARGSDGAQLRPAGWLTCGGSSGGAAVAVAIGAARAALGSDTGGSVRQPAAFCGVVGLKPSRGAVPRWGLLPYASSLDTVGVIARTVADAGALFDVVRGADGRDEACGALAPPPPPQAHAAAAAGAAAAAAALPLAGLRVGVPAEYHVAGLDGAALEWWEWGAAALARAGAEVVPVSLPHTRLALPAYYVMAPAEAASNLARFDGLRFGARGGHGGARARAPAADAPAGALHELLRTTRSAGFGREVTRRVLVGNAVLSAGARCDFFEGAVAAAALVGGDFAAVLRAGGRAPPAGAPLFAAAAPAATPRAHPAHGVDALLTPAAPSPPWVVGDTAARAPLAMYLNDVMTLPASLAGLPAACVPVGYAPYPRAARARAGAAAAAAAEEATAAHGGLCVPVALQVVGRHGDEATLLRVAAALEDAANFSLPQWFEEHKNDV